MRKKSLQLWIMIIGFIVSLQALSFSEDMEKNNSIKSSEKQRSLQWQLVFSGLGGANYFVNYAHSKNPWTGWGESYGIEGELCLIYEKGNIGLGLSYGKIYETTVANRPFVDIIWTRKVTRNPFLLKIFFNPNGKINPWFGFGKDIYNISYVEQEYDLYNIHYKFRETDLEGTENFQIISLGAEIKTWRNIGLIGECRYGVNETENTLENADFQSWQFILGLNYKFNQ